MRQLQQFLWLIGLLVSTSTLVNAQEDRRQKEQLAEDKWNSLPKMKLSVQARGAYDFKNYYGASNFGPATIPMKKDPDNREKMLFDIADATLSIEKVLLFPGGDNLKLVAKTRLKKNLELKSVYADFKGFGIGKDVTNFCDPDACDLVGGSFVQVRWHCQLTPCMNFAVAIEETAELVIYPEIKKKDRSKEELQPYKNLPTLSAKARYGKEKSWHVQLSGLLRPLEYYNKSTQLNIILPAWGINLGSTIHMVPETTIFKIQSVYGQGIGNYIADLGDLEKEPNTLFVKKNGATKCEILGAWGVGVGLEHKWLPKLSSALAYRFVNVLDEHRGKDAYKNGHAASCNLFYHPTEQVKIGAEYLFGVRKNIGDEQKDAHRIQAVIAFEL